jgi:hypothetical protein
MQNKREGRAGDDAAAAARLDAQLAALCPPTVTVAASLPFRLPAGASPPPAAWSHSRAARHTPSTEDTRERKSCRVGPKVLRWPDIFTANTYERPQVGPAFGPTLQRLRLGGFSTDKVHRAAPERRHRPAAPPGVTFATSGLDDPANPAFETCPGPARGANSHS